MGERSYTETAVFSLFSAALPRCRAVPERARTGHSMGRYMHYRKPPARDSFRLVRYPPGPVDSARQILDDYSWVAQASHQRQEGAGTAVLRRDGTLAPFAARTMLRVCPWARNCGGGAKLAKLLVSHHFSFTTSAERRYATCASPGSTRVCG